MGNSVKQSEVSLYEMDLTLVFAGLSGLIIIVLVVFLLKQRSAKKVGGARFPQPHGRPVEGNLPRRAMAVRNARARLRAAAGGAAAEEDNNEAGGEAHVDDVEIDGKVGAKKRAKLEAKAERKHQREIDEREREDKKRKLELDEEERAKLSEKERLEEEKRAEEEKMAKEEKERQEQKEYLRMKAAFSIEEEGYDENDLESEECNLLQEFILYIKNNKVVVLEDIAAHFKLKTQNVIDRIQDLQTEGILTGVIDDRGKFIYIPREELEAVAKFVKRCGRVSLSELAESSNKLINLNPAITT